MGFNILLKAQLEYLLSKLKPQIRTYATSSTAKDVVDKVATLNGFILNTGAKVTVKFTDTSATSPSSGNISLNVNSTGAKTVISSLDNTACTYEDADNFCGNKTQQFIYDGTNWVWLKGSDSEVVTYTGGDGIQINNNEIKVATNSMFKFVNGVLAVNTDKIPNMSYVKNAVRPANYLIGYNLNLTYEGVNFKITGNYIVLSGASGENAATCVYSSTEAIPAGKYKIITNVHNSSHPLSLDGVSWVLTVGRLGYTNQTYNITSVDYDIEFESEVTVNISILVAANYDFGNIQGIYEISFARVLGDSSSNVSDSDMLITTDEFDDFT